MTLDREERPHHGERFKIQLPFLLELFLLFPNLEKKNVELEKHYTARRYNYTTYYIAALDHVCLFVRKKG